jgi:polyhydroxybutyrate depolymerase
LDPEGVIMAFPTGLIGPGGTSWNLGPCCVSGPDDQAFARQLVTQVQKKACIDSRRVYAVGVATGGGMAYSLACHAADVFAAIAPTEWDFLTENMADCTPSRSITVVMFRGTANSLVPYAGGYSTVVPTMPITFLGAKASFEKWAKLDQCTGSASGEDNDGCSTYSSCTGGVEVILCTKQGGIMEPGTPRISWPVLKQHPMPP